MPRSRAGSLVSLLALVGCGIGTVISSRRSTN